MRYLSRSVAVATDVIELTRLFIEAFNARDLDALRPLIADEIEFRNPQGGRSLHGYDGAREVITAADRINLRLLREGQEEVEELDDGGKRVIVPVTELIGRDEMHTTAEFEIRDGRVTAFEIISVD